jgi:hypothetical protein
VVVMWDSRYRVSHKSFVWFVPVHKIYIHVDNMKHAR